MSNNNNHYQKRHYFEIAKLLAETKAEESVINAFVDLFALDNNALFRPAQFRQEVKLQRFISYHPGITREQAERQLAKYEQVDA